MSHTTNTAWQALQNLATTTPNIDELFADSSRSEKFRAAACGIYMDYSKQALDNERLSALIALAKSKNLSHKINELLSGVKVNDTENRAALHTALRLPKGESLLVDGVDVGGQVHDSLDKCEAIVSRIRTGVWRG